MIREETKQLVAQILAEKMVHFEANKKTEPKIDGFGSFLANLVSQGFCPSCGSSYTPVSKPVACCLCLQSFCSKCVKPLANKKVVEVMDYIQAENYGCEKCTLIMLMQEESEERKRLRNAKYSSPLVPLYETLLFNKKNLLLSIPQYEYLVSSIIEVQKSSNDQQKEDESWGMSYSAVKTTERKLMGMFTSYQQSAQPFSDLDVTRQKTKPKAETAEEMLIWYIHTAHVDFMKQTLPRFKDIQQRVGKEELNQTSKVYLLLQQLYFETQFHPFFKGQWQAELFPQAIREIRKEVEDICGESDWNSYEDSLQKRIKRRQKSLTVDPSRALVLQKKNEKSSPAKSPTPVSLEKLISAINEPMLIRKVITLVKQMADRFSLRRLQAPTTNKMLGYILHKLESHINSVISS